MAERSAHIKDSDLLNESERDLWREYEHGEEEPYFNKKDHFARSANNQPNHLKAAKKKLPFNVTRKIPS